MSWRYYIKYLLSGDCDAGYYCPGGNIIPNPPDTICPPGRYCIQGSATYTSCPAGTFSNASGNVEESDCTNCTAGSVCIHNTNALCIWKVLPDDVATFYDFGGSNCLWYLKQHCWRPSMVISLIPCSLCSMFYILCCYIGITSHVQAKDGIP